MIITCCFAEIIHGCQITKTVVEGYIRGRKAKTREAMKTIHRQHQTVDTINNITVRMGCRRPQPLETTRQSSDGGQRSHMICRKEEDYFTGAWRWLIDVGYVGYVVSECSLDSRPFQTKTFTWTIGSPNTK